MAKIGDFECRVNGCEFEAAEIVGTDDDEFELLCRDHYLSGWEWHIVEIGDRALMRDTAGSWFFLPEKLPAVKEEEWMP